MTIHMVGLRFGRLRVESLHGVVNRHRMWLCVCDCGNQTVVEGSNMRRGLTSSCGCLHSEVASAAAATHRMSKTSMYSIWRNMIARCDDKSQKRYGGRGISVCERWLTSFENFLTDMGRRPSSSHSLDRIDVNGNYEPNNCRWATSKQQARNTSRNRLVEFCGEILPLIAHCENAGLSYKTVHKRLRDGWSVDRALTTKISQAA